MSHPTDFTQQDRLTATAFAANACETMPGMVLCPVPTMFAQPVAASWAAMYRAAYELAVRQVAAARPSWYGSDPSMN